MSNPTTLPLLAVEPDWPLTMTLRFVTDIFTTPSGRETRTSLAQNPRVLLELPASVWGFDKANALQRFLRLHMGQQWAVPLWSETMIVSQNTTGSGDLSIPVKQYANRLISASATAARAVAVFADSGPVVLAVNSLTPPDGTNPPKIAVANAPALQLAAGTLVVPVMVTQEVLESHDLSWRDARSVSGTLSLHELATEMKPLPFECTVPSYDGRMVFPFGYEWSSAPKESFTRSAVTQSVPSGVARVLVTDDNWQSGQSPRWLAPRRSWNVTTWLDGREAIAQAMAFFAALKGRMGRCWVPTRKQDLAVKALTPGEVVVATSDLDDLDIVQHRYWLFWCEGQWAVRYISNLDPHEDGTTSLMLNSPIPYWEASRVIASQLLCARSSLDELAIKFGDTCHATAEWGFVELPEELLTLETTSGTQAEATASGIIDDIGMLRTFALLGDADPIVGGYASVDGFGDIGSAVTLTAWPRSDHRFVRWTDGEQTVCSAATYTFKVTGPRAVVPHFIRLCTIAVSASPSAGGSVHGGGVYDANTQITVTATPAAGMSFVNWKEGDTVVSTSPNYTFTVTGNRNLTANFATT